MAFDDVAYCRMCGRMIKFIWTKNAKRMPCDSFSVTIIPDRNGKLYYEAEQRPIYGKKCDPDEPGAVRVFEPHYYTCPKQIPKRAKQSKAESEAEAEKARQAKMQAEKAKAEEAAQRREMERRQTCLFRV